MGLVAPVTIDVPVTLSLRIKIGGADVRPWRLRVLGWCARLLRVPVDVVEAA